MPMKLSELAPSYRSAAAAIGGRIRELRRALAGTDDPGERAELRRRMRELAPLLRQTRELAELMEHYYERGYYRNERYRI